MNSHDVGRGRGGVRSALQRFGGHLVLAAVDSDRLYPSRLTDELALSGRNVTQRTIASPHGHDGFLIEIEQVGGLISDSLRS